MISSLPWKCDNPIIIVNRKYARMHKDVRWRFSDNNDYYLSVPCGRCALCKQRVSNDWRVRLTVECRNTPTHYHEGNQLPRVLFVTFTLSDKYYNNETGEEIFADYLVKFRDNFRKKFGRSPRYFAITDRGSQYGRLHLHMLLFNPMVYDKVRKQYTRKVSNTELHKVRFWYGLGIVDSEWVVNPNVSAYVVGYITGANMNRELPVKHGRPICENALRYKPRIFPSKGLGKQWLTRENMDKAYREELHTVQLDGFFYAMPRYYSTAIWTDEELHMQRNIRLAETWDYWLRTGLNPRNVFYKYKRGVVAFDRNQELIKHREKFVTKAKQIVKPKAIYEVNGFSDFDKPIFSFIWKPTEFIYNIDIPNYPY